VIYDPFALEEAEPWFDEDEAEWLSVAEQERREMSENGA